MRGRKFFAGEKKTHKMTRDGLVERSALSKEERRISSRTADFSLDKKKPRQKTQESKGKHPKGKTQKQRDFYDNLREETISPYEALEQEVMAAADDEATQEEEILPQKGQAFQYPDQKKNAVRKETPFRRISFDTKDASRLSFQKEERFSDRIERDEEYDRTTDHHSSDAVKEKHQRKSRRTFQFDRQEQTKEESLPSLKHSNNLKRRQYQHSSKGRWYDEAERKANDRTLYQSFTGRKGADCKENGSFGNKKPARILEENGAGWVCDSS